MDDDELRALLARVQAGELTPEEAAALLQPPAPPTDDRPPESAPPPGDGGRRRPSADASDFEGVRIVRVRSTANRTKIIGDRSVRTLRVQGPHRIRIDGDEAVVENEIGEDLFGGEGSRHIRIAANAGRRVRIQGIQGFRGHEVLEVRINPSLPLDFDCDAGMIEILGTEAPLSGRVNAGNAVIEDFTGTINLSVNAGKLRASGRIDGGSSSVDVNVGKADVLLEPGSNVRILRSATLGSAEADDDVVGAGDGTLRITCSLGAVRVHSPNGSLRMEHRL
jgi:hypothetical protein